MSDLSKTSCDLGTKVALNLQWVGDISLNGRYCCPMNYMSLRDNIKQIVADFGECDIRIGNFESPLWGDGGVNLLKVPRLCTTEDAVESISALKLDVALLANNHVYDCLEKGFENTVNFLDRHKIKYLGAGFTQQEASEPLVLERNGIRVGLLNYVGTDTHPNIPEGAGVFLNMFEEERVLNEISDLIKRSDIILLHLHWGAEELIRLPSQYQREFARKAVEAGAKVVVCHHSHCLQSCESWGKGHIFYGLGNFIFGDVDGKDWPEISSWAAVAIALVSSNKVEDANLKYLYQRDLILEWDRRESRRRMQNRLNLYVKFKPRLYGFVFRCELFYQKVILAYFRFIKRSGGFLPSMMKIRKKHLTAIQNIIFGLK